jgi:DNA-directed RNA polymerase subunit M/transcription elongation factor TFIIS
MDFCPMCKKLLVPGTWRGKKAGRCPCGFVRTSGLNLEHESINNSEIMPAGISPEIKKEGVDFVCKKCGHNKADTKDLGEILGNEKSVTLFTCLNCGSVERR